MDYVAKRKTAKVKKELLTANLRLRLRPGEKEAFVEAARKDGRALSGWLRYLARQAAERAGVKVP